MNKVSNKYLDQSWQWWPLLPLYPYGSKATIFKEIIPKKIWSFEQLQGLYYVAVPVRMSVVKVLGGLMILNPLAPTKELMRALNKLEKDHGPVLSIVLPTASGLEHKIFLPALSRALPNAELWVCPGQWSFPIPLPLGWIGIPEKRTKILFNDGFPHEESCEWLSLGPLDIGLGRFQEISCFHKGSQSLLVTDALIGIESNPPDLFEKDPTPLLFHARDSGDQFLNDSNELRKKGWKRLVLFASYLRPSQLEIPPLLKVIRNSFKPGLRNPRAHFGFYPFYWKKNWTDSVKDLIGETTPLLQIAPVLERLVFPRAKASLLAWLEKLEKLKGIRWLIPAHYSAPIRFTPCRIRGFRKQIENRIWAQDKKDWSFLSAIDKNLLSAGVVPRDPLKAFKD